MTTDRTRGLERPHGHASPPTGIRIALEVMAVVYVAVAVFFLVNPNGVILFVNTFFDGHNWPVVFFPTERFWYALAFSVPATRAFLAFSASRRPEIARFCLQVLEISLLVAGIMFACHFVFSNRAPLYALGATVELVQVGFYSLLGRRLS